MKKRLHQFVLVASIATVVFLNLGQFVQYPPVLQQLQYHLWHFHTPWLFFTDTVVRKDKELRIHSECVFKACDLPIGDFRFKALALQNAIESGAKVRLLRKEFCPHLRGPAFTFEHQGVAKELTCDD